MKINAYAATQPNKALAPFQYVSSMHETAIRIAITHCGVCHSDLDFIANTFGDSHFPVIPGHEIVGEVVEVGNKVTRFQPGDRVGVSWQLRACGHCTWCRQQEEVLCPEFQAIGINQFGGFADYIVVEQAFVHAIPESIASELAAPLMCAGSTVMTAIEQLPLQAGMRVGIIGMGGLGHMAVKFLSVLGCDITVFDNDITKKSDAIQFGAREFFNAPPHTASSDFHYMFSMADTAIDLQSYLALLRPRGTFVFLGMPKTPMTLPLFEMMIAQRSITAVPLGGPGIVEKTLRFAATHHLFPEIELLPMREVNTALMKLKRHEPRYRFVLYR